MRSTGPVLFYDTGCSVCRRFVEFVVRADRTGTLRIAALRGSRADVLRVAHADVMAINSAIWVPVSGVPVNQSDAILATLDYLGGRWRWLARVARLVPRALRNRVYRSFAGHRNWFGRWGIASLGPDATARVLDETPLPRSPDGPG
jgi:predicted DCC family thiol-disulfide oxidoreductase YuxK